MSKNIESVAFDTVPSHFLGLSFKSDEPHDQVQTIWRNGETIKVPGFNPNISELPVSRIWFDIPTKTVDAIISYLDIGFGRSHVRNCHDFVANVGDYLPRNNYQESTKTLNQHNFSDPLTVGEIHAGDLIAVAHPGFLFCDFGGLQIDHSCLALGEGQALEISGLGGAFAINSLEQTLYDAREVMAKAITPGIWKDERRPTSEDIQLYRIPPVATANL